MFEKYCSEGIEYIKFDKFVGLMINLMKRHSQMLKGKKDVAMQWFVMYVDDDPNSLPLYYNTEEHKMT